MTVNTFDTNNHPIAKKKVYWDELIEGQQLSYGQYQVSEKEIIAFAKRFDPMDFHTDPEKAKLSPLGALCASGIHTLGIMQRLTFDHIYKHWHIVAGKELSKCQFLRPVFVNDTLSVNMKIIRLQAESHAKRGSAEINFVVINAQQQPVLEVQGEIILLKNNNYSSA